MIDVKELLYEICEDKHVYEDAFDLIQSGLLDSYAFIELFTRLEEKGIEIYPTRIDRTRLRTPKSIQELVNEYRKN